MKILKKICSVRFHQKWSLNFDVIYIVNWVNMLLFSGINTITLFSVITDSMWMVNISRRFLISQLDPGHTMRASRNTMRGKTRLHYNYRPQHKARTMLETANNYASLAKLFWQKWHSTTKYFVLNAKLDTIEMMRTLLCGNLTNLIKPKHLSFTTRDWKNTPSN